MTAAASERIAREAPAEISFAIDIALGPAIGLGLSMELAPCVARAAVRLSRPPGAHHRTSADARHLTSKPHFAAPILTPPPRLVVD